VSMPIRVSRHSKASSVPVVIAILGMLVYWPPLSPSMIFLGRRNKDTGGVSTIGLFAHWWVTIDDGMVTWRRHFPSCMTSGKSTLQGTLSSVKDPVASVIVEAIG